MSDRDTQVVCTPSGDVVAYGWNHPQHADVSLRRVLLTGTVHPDWRGRHPSA